jgi:hypothetical protein
LICRGVIVDEELEIVEGLIEYTLDLLPEVGGPVVDWQKY